MKNLLFICLIFLVQIIQAQSKMSPELLWKLGRINPVGISEDEKIVYCKFTKYEVLESKKKSTLYALNLTDGKVTEVEKALIKYKNISPDGISLLYSADVKIKKINGKSTRIWVGIRANEGDLGI